jgi:hypothetical protein
MNAFLRLSALCLAGLFTALAAEAKAPDASGSNAAPDATVAAYPAAAAIEPVRPAVLESDPCLSSELSANPTRPTWDIAAATTQCGALETDFGFQWQAMGQGVAQQALPSSIRYGFTPRLDLRWGLIGHQWQSGGGSSPVQGAGDQWLSARYRFRNQGRISPAMAFDYGFKIPSASPAKGFGTGYADQQFLFIASRDIRHSHLDFNMVGTLAGSAHGHEGAAQFGLVLTQPVTKKFSALLESYGGPQPGTADRYGAALAGAAYTLRPWLVFDGAYSQAYTAGLPRRQVIFGFTIARRAGWPPLSRSFAPARLLGR